MADENITLKKNVPIFIAISIFVLTVLTTPSFSSSSGEGLYLITLALSGGGMAWIYHKLGYFWGFLASVVSYLLSWTICDSPILALASLSVIPCGIAYSLLSKRKLTRSYTVAVSGVSVSLIFLVIVFLTVYNQVGEFNISAIKVVFSSFFDMMRNALIESFTVTVAGQTVPFITAENADEYINLVIGIMPGVITALITVLCFFAGLIYKLILSLTHCELPYSDDWKLSPSPITAAFFCVSLLLSVAAGDANIIWLAAVNISLVLFPSFFFAGASSVMQIQIVNGIPRPRVLRRILFFGSLFIALPLTIIIAALFGVIDSIKTLFPKKDQNT